MSSPNKRKVVVLIHDFFYAIEVYDKKWSKVSPAEIEKQLLACVQDVELRLRDETATPIGVLTADHRDRWAEVSLFPSAR